MKTKCFRFVFYLMVSLEAFFVCMLGIASGVFYLMFTKSSDQVQREIIKCYFTDVKLFVPAIFIAAAALVIVGIIVIFIYSICHSKKTNKTKYEATVTTENGQPPTYTVKLHEKGKF